MATWRPLPLFFFPLDLCAVPQEDYALRLLNTYYHHPSLASSLTPYAASLGFLSFSLNTLLSSTAISLGWPGYTACKAPKLRFLMSTSSFGSALAVHETQSDNVYEFTRHPNFHIVSAFFSGFVFWCSLCHLLRSPFAHYIRRRFISRISICWTRHRYRQGIISETDSEAHILFEKDAAFRESGNRSSLSEAIFRRQDNPTLIFVLTLLFFMSSLSQFASSLVFSLDFNRSSARDQTFCAFLVAWDSMSLQSARLIGLTVLGLNLCSLGVKRKEIIIFWAVVGVIAILIIVANTLQIGILSLTYDMMWQRDPVTNKLMALCHRRHKLAPSLVLSLIAMGVEIYCIIRLLSVIAPPSFPLQRRLNALSQDIRIVRGFSLLVFDLIVFVPNSITTTYLGDTLPFSISALIVLATFNDYHPPLPLFHQDTARTKNVSRHIPDSEHLARYKALMVNPHPYSAAALSMNASQPQARRTEGYPELATSSGLEGRLLVQAVTSGTYFPSGNRDDKASPERPIRVLPTSPSEKSPQPKRKSRSGSRMGLRRTRTSIRSRKSQLVRPIIPKAELARQFNDNERTTDPPDAQVLAPRPLAYMYNRTISVPIRPPPPAALRSNVSATRRHSATESMTQTLGSVSIHYGSDILRPEPGHITRDRMRAPESVHARSPLTTLTHVSSTSGSDTTILSGGNAKSHTRESWSSDPTIDVYTVMRLAPAVRSIPTFNGGWPVPPSAIPTARILDDRGGHLGQPSNPDLSRRAIPAVSKLRLNPADEVELTPTPREAGVRWNRQPSVVRGPRMQFPPPRSRTSRT